MQTFSLDAHRLTVSRSNEVNDGRCLLAEMIKKTRNFVNNEDNNFNIKKLGKIKNIENSSRTRKFYFLETKESSKIRNLNPTLNYIKQILIDVCIMPQDKSRLYRVNAEEKSQWSYFETTSKASTTRVV